MKAGPSVHRACALILALACAACTTAPQKPALDARPAETPAAPAAKPPLPPKPPPVAPPKDVEPVPPAPPSKAVEELRKGVQRYDDGQYKEAARHFQQALEQGLATPADRANAHKHLAFIACGGRRTSACRSEFRKALQADPAFDLTPAEAGHPMWGPVFRSVKAEAAKKRKPVKPAASATAATSR